MSYQCLLQEEARWAEVDLPVMPYKDMRDVFILGAIDNIVEQLDDSLVTLNNILGSRFVGPVREVVEAAHQRLLLLQACDSTKAVLCSCLSGFTLPVFHASGCASLRTLL